MLRKKKCTTTVILIGLMILCSVNVYGQSYDFKDMPDNWSTLALQEAVKNNLLHGYEGRIKPNDDITRAEVATVINRAFNSQDRINISRYNDVNENDWFYSEIEKAINMETFRGNNNKFNPNLPITREEVFLVIARALKLKDSDYSIKNFNDTNELSSWAKGKVFAMVNNGYVKGSESNLNPKGNITRAEFAQVMHNIIKKYISDSGIKSLNNIGNLMINSSGVTLENSYISGDLIIGDGVGDGCINLEDVIIEGRLLVRGGGENSIIISGNSKIGSTTIARLGGKVRLNVNTGVDVGDIIVNGNYDAIFKGNYNIVNIISDNVRAIFIDSNVNIINVSGENSGTDIDVDSEVEELNVNNINGKVEVKGKVDKINITEEAEVTEVEVDEGGEVNNINVKGKNTKIIGKGQVKKVNIDGDNTKIETEGTEIVKIVDIDSGKSENIVNEPSNQEINSPNDEVELYYRVSGVGMPTANIKIDINGEVNEFSLLFDDKKLASTTDGIITVASSILKDISRIKILFNGKEYSNINKIQW